MSELHCESNAAHPSVYRTLEKVKINFGSQGITGHVRAFVENSTMFQMDKSDHTLIKGKLESVQLLEHE